MQSILVKRALQLKNNVVSNPTLISNKELMKRLHLNIAINGIENIMNVNNIFLNDSVNFYKKNINTNLIKFNQIKIRNYDKYLNFPGLYINGTNGQLVFLFSTFNNQPIARDVMNFIKMKLSIITELTGLKECNIHKFYYNEITKYEYLKIKRNPSTLFSVSINNNYYNLINLENEITKNDVKILESAFPEIRNLKRKRNMDNKIVKKRKYNIDSEWISASKLRNFSLNDPLLDWFQEYNITDIHDRPDRIGGNSSSKRSMFKQDNDFISMIKEQGLVFENMILRDLKQKYNNEVVQIAESYQARDFDKFLLTLEHMKKGTPIIYQAVLHNEENKTYGCPDFLIRSDWINKLFGNNIDYEEEFIQTSEINNNNHYVILDVKASTLNLNSNGLTLRNEGSIPAYKTQILIYNLALGKLQGYLPDKAYILGKKWKFTSKNNCYYGDNCYDKLGVIDYTANDNIYYDRVNNGLEWIRDVRKNGHKWKLLPYPSKRELYPNMCNEKDGNWRRLKKDLANKIDEITLLWMCSQKNREIAFDNNVNKWTHIDCNSDNLGITGPVKKRVLDQILTVNKSDNLLILPEKINNTYMDWHLDKPLEFFIDFETMTSIFSPLKVGDNYEHSGHNMEQYIFMIGLGYIHPITKKWIYQDFTVNTISQDEEQKIIDNMWEYIDNLCNKYNQELPNFYHWSHAEPTCYLKANKRHNNRWNDLIFCDMLKVFKKEPIVINGALNFGLKTIAKAMFNNDMIDVIWDNENPCSNGLTAMVLAWKTYQRRALTDIHESPVIQDIIKYNEMDCRVIWEIVNYLRNNNI